MCILRRLYNRQKIFDAHSSHLYQRVFQAGWRHGAVAILYMLCILLLSITIIKGEINIPEGTEMVMPGYNLTITVDLINTVALDKGVRFAIREGGRTVGAGQITSIIE